MDIAALGAPGVPQDVSPEEIAAIAAAAAQMQATSIATLESAENKRPDRSDTVAEGHVTHNFESPALNQSPSAINNIEVRSSASEESAPPEKLSDTSSAETLAATFAETSSEKVEVRSEEHQGEIRRESEIAAAAVRSADVIAASPALSPATKAPGPTAWHSGSKIRRKELL